MSVIAHWAKEVLHLDNLALVVAVVAVGGVLSFVQPRWGRRWLVTIALGFWLLSTPLISALLARPLAYGFHPIEDPRQAGSAEAIVVLGGGIREATAGSQLLAYPSRSTALRTVEAVRVFRLLGSRPLIVASGGTPQAGQRVPEGLVIADDLARLQVPRDHILVEGTSLTTHDEAIKVTRLLQSRGIRRFVIVTSPTHMRRSLAVFRAQHAEVIASTAPLDVDSRYTQWSLVPRNDALQMSDQALYDYVATLYYWLRGWFRPAPDQGSRHIVWLRDARSSADLIH